MFIRESLRLRNVYFLTLFAKQKIWLVVTDIFVWGFNFFFYVLIQNKLHFTLTFVETLAPPLSRTYNSHQWRILPHVLCSVFILRVKEWKIDMKYNMKTVENEMVFQSGASCIYFLKILFLDLSDLLLTWSRSVLPFVL